MVVMKGLVVVVKVNEVRVCLLVGGCKVEVDIDEDRVMGVGGVPLQGTKIK